MLHVDQISKRFGDHQALTDVTFDVHPGRITGFVGANGAGKTTTMRIILGVTAADAGAVTFRGQPLTGEDRRSIGYMPEERGLYPKMRVAEQITYFGRLHGMPLASAAASTAALLDRLEIADRAGDAVETLSLGNQQRAQIAAALVHKPQILVLDEPFSGLDPLGVDAIVDVLKEAAEGGAPILFSSHQLELVERICDDLIIIAGGRVRASGSREELRRTHATNSWELHAPGSPLDWIAGMPKVHNVTIDGDHARFTVSDPSAAQHVLMQAALAGPVVSFHSEEPTLATIFKEVIQ